MFKKLLKKEQRSTAPNLTRLKIAKDLGLDPEEEYPLFRGFIGKLEEFYSVFLKFDYRGLLQEFDSLDDKAESKVLKQKYEFLIMSVEIAVSRSRASLFTRDYASVFIPNKSIQELRSSDFKARTNEGFPMRLIRLHELIAADTSFLLNVENLKNALFEHIPFVCPEYFELLLCLYDREDSLTLEEIYDLLLPIPGLREGMTENARDFLFNKSVVSSGLSEDVFVREWKLLLNKGKRELHPHLRSFVQWGTLVDEFV